MYYHQQPPYYPASRSNSGATTPKTEAEVPSCRPLSAPTSHRPNPARGSSPPRPPECTRRARSVGPRLMSFVAPRARDEALCSRTASEVTCSSPSASSLSAAASPATSTAHFLQGAVTGCSELQNLAEYSLPPDYSWNPSENYPDFYNGRAFYDNPQPSSPAQCGDVPWDGDVQPYPLQVFDCQYPYQYPYPIPDWVHIQMERNQAILNQLAQNYAQYGSNSYEQETDYYGSLPQSNPWMNPQFEVFDEDISETESLESYELDKEISAAENYLWSTLANVDDSEYGT